jgi:hypothetical protein
MNATPRLSNAKRAPSSRHTSLVNLKDGRALAVGWDVQHFQPPSWRCPVRPRAFSYRAHGALLLEDLRYRAGRGERRNHNV